MKKVILALLCVIILSGCKAEYNITFDKKMNVDEELFGYENDEFYDSYTNSSYNRVISFILEPSLDYFNNNDYSIKTGDFDGNKGAKINRSFNNFNEYKEIYGAAQLYEVSSKSEDPEIRKTSLEKLAECYTQLNNTDGHINTDEQNQEKYYVSDLKLNITLPFEVKDSNADSVNKNTYTWNFNKENNNREIVLSFDKNKIKVDYTMYIIFGSIALVLIIIVMFFYFKVKNRDKLNEI